MRILRGELIGKNIKVVHLKERREMEGKVIDETKNIVVLKTRAGNKRLVKSCYAFEFAYGKKRIRIEGRYFNKRPEDRIKTSLR